MSRSIMDFLRWIVGSRGGEFDDLSAALAEEGLGDTPISDVQAGLDLIAANASADVQAAIAQYQAQLDAAVENHLQGGSTGGTELTAGDLASVATSPELPPGIAVHTEPASTGPVQDEPELPPGLELSHEPVELPPGVEISEDPGPGTPASPEQPPPPTHDADDEPPPPEDDANGDAPAESWAGHDVHSDNGSTYVEIDGQQLHLEPDGQGGYYAMVGEHRLETSPEGDLIWTNTPTGTHYPVSEVLDNAITIAHPTGATLTLHDNGFLYSVPSGTTLSFGHPYEFHSLSDTGIVVVNPEDGYLLDWSPDSAHFIDPDTGDTYDNLNDLYAAQQDHDQDADDEPPPEDGANGDAPTESWAGHDVHADNGNTYIEVDGQQLHLQPDGQGGYYATVGEHHLETSPEGDLIWTNTPTGAHYPVSEVLDNGIAIAHPTGATVTFDENSVRYTWPGDGGGGTASLSVGAPYEFHSLSDTGMVLAHPEDGYLLEWEPDGIQYIDPDNGDTYDTLDDLHAAQQDNTQESDDEPPPDDVGLPATQLPADPAELDEDSMGDATPPEDGIYIWSTGTEVSLQIVWQGEVHDLPLQDHNGGLFVTIDGQPMEVHSQDGTYFVVRDGQGYDLMGDPSSPDWPYDNEVEGNIDVPTEPEDWASGSSDADEANGDGEDVHTHFPTNNADPADPDEPDPLAGVGSEDPPFFTNPLLPADTSAEDPGELTHPPDEDTPEET